MSCPPWIRLSGSRNYAAVVTGNSEYRSLGDALIEFGIPWENHAFVKRIEPAIAFVRFVCTSGYIRADRADGGPSLNIASGWTNGFVDEQEIIAIFGDVDRWGDGGRQPLWGVSHPLNRIGHGGGGRAGAADRSYEVCQRCFIELPAAGVCDCRG